MLAGFTSYPVFLGLLLAGFASCANMCARSSGVLGRHETLGYCVESLRQHGRCGNLFLFSFLAAFGEFLAVPGVGAIGKLISHHCEGSLSFLGTLG